MKKTFLLFILLASVSGLLRAQPVYEDYFVNKTLRLDYIQAGNAKNTNLYLQQLKSEPYWGGSKQNLLDIFNYGEYKLQVFDSATGKLIYSRGYSSLYQEWQATAEAQTISRGFYETVTMPYPKNSILVQIDKRNKEEVFEKIFETRVNPSDYMILSGKSPKYETKKVLDSGDPSVKVDMVIIPDGYTKDDMQKFEKDVERFMGYFFNCSPYKENKSKFNIWIVKAPSEESGTDLPGKNIWNNTILNSSFYTFGIERYLMTTDIKSVRDVSACAPYDQIMILVNSGQYGGGAVYNYYNMTSSDNDYSDYVFCHEFGHGFGSLADEYYTSDVAVVDYINQKIEPNAPNITTLVDFGKKWKSMVKEGTPIPTPSTPEYKDVVGAFEGGAYVSKGVYRPMQDCTMKSRLRDSFCPVCKDALQRMINFYSE